MGTGSCGCSCSSNHASHGAPAHLVKKITRGFGAMKRFSTKFDPCWKVKSFFSLSEFTKRVLVAAQSTLIRACNLLLLLSRERLQEPRSAITASQSKCGPHGCTLSNEALVPEEHKRVSCFGNKQRICNLQPIMHNSKKFHSNTLSTNCLKNKITLRYN